MRRLVLPLLMFAVAGSLHAEEKKVEVEWRLVSSPTPIFGSPAIDNGTNPKGITSLSGVLQADQMVEAVKQFQRDQAEMTPVIKASALSGERVSTGSMQKTSTEPVALGDFKKYGQLVPKLSEEPGTEVGYRMTFVPKVGADGYTIHLQMGYEARRLSGFQETLVTGTATFLNKFTPDQLAAPDFPRLRWPIIEFSDLQTAVSTYDGTTIVFDLGKVAVPDGTRHSYALITARLVK